jgi:hypothetical protein
MGTQHTAVERPLRRVQVCLRYALLAGTMLLAYAVGSAGGADAEAALAVGLPADVTKQGVAVGWAINHATGKAAQAEALRRCREAREPPQATRELCRIVESFKDACVAVALDPDAGTGGIGWAVEKAEGTAEAAAMEDCRHSAGEQRRAACRIALARCDGG